MKIAVGANRKTPMLLLLLALSAGGNTPDKGFQQRIKDRDAQTAGVPYASLESQMPQRQTYDASKTDQFVEQAKEAAAGYSATYGGLLDKLDSDKQVDHMDSAARSWRAIETVRRFLGQAASA